MPGNANLMFSEPRITIFVMCNDLDVGSEVMLDLFDYCANEVNTMIFPVVDYFEIKDWLFNHIKTNSSEVFEQLKGLRNEVEFLIKLDQS
jgi:hypothetical protein